MFDTVNETNQENVKFTPKLTLKTPVVNIQVDFQTHSNESTNALPYF